MVIAIYFENKDVVIFLNCSSTDVVQYS